MVGVELLRLLVGRRLVAGSAGGSGRRLGHARISCGHEQAADSASTAATSAADAGLVHRARPGAPRARPPRPSRIAASGAGQPGERARTGAPPGARAGRARRPAPGRPPQRGQRRRPRVVDDLEHHRHVGARGRAASSSWAAAGIVETTHVAVDRRRRRASRPSTVGPAGAPRARSTVSPAALGRRGPAAGPCARRGSASASPIEAAVAPPPSIVAPPTGPSYRSRIAAAAPGTSVLSACTGAVAEHQRVGRAGARPARSPTDGRRAASASRFSGIVSDRPRHVVVEPAEERRAARPTRPARRRTPSPARARRTPPGAAPATASGRSGRPRTAHLHQPACRAARPQQSSEVSQYSL